MGSTSEDHARRPPIRSFTSKSPETLRTALAASCESFPKRHTTYTSLCSGYICARGFARSSDRGTSKGLMSTRGTKVISDHTQRSWQMANVKLDLRPDVNNAGVWLRLKNVVKFLRRTSIGSCVSQVCSRTFALTLLPARPSSSPRASQLGLGPPQNAT